MAVSFKRWHSQSPVRNSKSGLFQPPAISSSTRSRGPRSTSSHHSPYSSRNQRSPSPLQSSKSTTSSLSLNTVQSSHSDASYVTYTGQRLSLNPEKSLSGSNLSERGEHRGRGRQSSGYWKGKAPKKRDNDAVKDPKGSLSPHSNGPAFMWCFGRRYLNDSYLLPSDLEETNRQNLCTILTNNVMGSPFTCPIDPLSPPRNILEVGCGSAYWSSLCHDFFVQLGLDPPAFTGMDFMPKCPDLGRLGVQWTYVQHDLRKDPWPFESDTFDLVMIKELHLVLTSDTFRHPTFPEALRVLKPGGYLECREMNLTLERIRLSQANRYASNMQDEMVARDTATYLVHPDTEHVPSENAFLRDLNPLIVKALSERLLSASVLHELSCMPQWPGFEMWNMKRVAIPLNTSLASWEYPESPFDDCASSDVMPCLTEDQRAIRTTALDIWLQLIRALEPMLNETCTKTYVEWQKWWDGMVDNLTNENGCAGGECLEVGSWFCRKLRDAA